MARRTLRVLVVDDEYLCRWAVRQLVLRCGHEVQETASGDAALAVADRFVPDVMLLDLRMPGMDGIELLERVRKRWPAVRPIIMTAHPTLETAIAALRLGAADYLTKPLDVGELESALARVDVRSTHPEESWA